jgi:hypothetical protein
MPVVSVILVKILQKTTPEAIISVNSEKYRGLSPGRESLMKERGLGEIPGSLSLGEVRPVTSNFPRRGMMGQE